ncbi:hypothetical protein FKM82_026625 [Ascaphus truei]
MALKDRWHPSPVCLPGSRPRDPPAVGITWRRAALSDANRSRSKVFSLPGDWSHPGLLQQGLCLLLPLAMCHGLR